MYPDYYYEDKDGNEITDPAKYSEGHKIVVDLAPSRVLPNSDMDLSNPSEKIDFPCSDLFLSHYHALGMTPRKPQVIDPTLERIHDSVSDLSDSLRGLQRLARPLKQQVNQAIGQQKYVQKKTSTEQSY